MRGENELRAFVTESNRIEGITREPTVQEISFTKAFLRVQAPTIDDVQLLVSIYQPGALLRDQPGMNVRVGNHIAPPGGPNIREELKWRLSKLVEADPWEWHCAFETLHPFSDGNGRSGRALWAWQMVRRQDGLPLGFLHHFYYQTLERSRWPSPAS